MSHTNRRKALLPLHKIVSLVKAQASIQIHLSISTSATYRNLFIQESRELRQSF